MLRGWLGGPALLCLLLANLPIQVAIKYVDVLAAGELRQQNVSTEDRDARWASGPVIRDVIIRPLRGRLDDAFFWFPAAVAFACWRINGVMADPRVPSLAAPAGRAVTYPLLALAYVGSVLLEPGTFFVRRPHWASTATQFLEGGLHLLMIYASLRTARLGRAVAAALAADRGVVDFREHREALLAAAAAPLWGFSVYFLAYQVITGEGLSATEFWATVAALVCYGLPFATVLAACRREWSDGFSIRWTSLNPFGAEVKPKFPPLAGAANAPPSEGKA